MTSVAQLHDALIGGLLAVPEFRTNVGDAVWTYLALLKAANFNGVVSRRSDQIAAALMTDEPTLLADLSRLSDLGLIRSLNPAPYLVIQLALWPGKADAPRLVVPAASSETPVTHSEVPVSGSAAAAASASQPEVGGQGEGGDLLDRVLTVLGPEADVEEMRDLLGAHPAETVRRALQRVEATPARQIRRSRTALFRYLLTKLNQAHRDHE
jgi:hypothetical protein